MIEQLDALVEADEEVLFRAPRSWWPQDFIEEIGMYGLALAALAGLGLISLAPADIWILAAAIAPILAYTGYTYQRDWSTAALVTDRRLLHRRGWLAPRVLQVNLRDLAEVRADRAWLRLDNGRGLVRDLNHPQEAWGLAVAACHGAGLPLPRLPARREARAEQLVALCFLVLALFLAVIVLKWLAASYGASLLETSLVLTVLVFLGAAVAAHTAAILLSLPAALGIMRFFMPREEVENWINGSIVFWPTPEEVMACFAEGEEAYCCFKASCLSLVAWLYGAQPAPPSSGHPGQRDEG